MKRCQTKHEYKRTQSYFLHTLEPFCTTVAKVVTKGYSLSYQIGVSKFTRQFYFEDMTWIDKKEKKEGRILYPYMSWKMFCLRVFSSNLQLNLDFLNQYTRFDYFIFHNSFCFIKSKTLYMENRNEYWI